MDEVDWYRAIDLGEPGAALTRRFVGQWTVGVRFWGRSGHHNGFLREPIGTD